MNFALLSKVKCLRVAFNQAMEIKCHKAVQVKTIRGQPSQGNKIIVDLVIRMSDPLVQVKWQTVVQLLLLTVMKMKAEVYLNREVTKIYFKKVQFMKATKMKWVCHLFYHRRFTEIMQINCHSRLQLQQCHQEKKINTYSLLKVIHRILIRMDIYLKQQMI